MTSPLSSIPMFGLQFNAPKVKPVCTRIPGIRYTFSFRVVVDLGDACILAFRELSCRRRFCQADAPSQAPAPDPSPPPGCWPTPQATPERADDAEGFSFWLARAEGAVYTHCGPKETKNGRTFITGGLYIPVRYYTRSPPDSDRTLVSAANVSCS